MASFYEELERTHEGASKAFASWEAVHVNFSHFFLQALREALGWPDEGFQRLRFEKPDVPSDARIGLGGYSTPAGYHFGVRLVHDRLELSFVYGCRLHDRGVFHVQRGNASWRVDPNRTSSLQPAIEDLERALREHVLRDALAELTGFAPET